MLPAPPGAAGPPGETAGEHLIVQLAGEQYALPGGSVREVLRWRAPTPVPGAPALLPGVISQRGVVLTTVDLRLLVGLSAAPPARSTRLVCVQHGAVDAALLVDAVDDLIRLAAADLAPPPASLTGATARIVRAVARHAGRPLAVLDLAALLAAVQEAL